MKIYLLAPVILALLIPLFLFAATYEDLESVVGQAKSLDEFLGRDDLQRKYEKVLRDYLEKRTGRCESFSKTIMQIKALVAEHPEFKTPIWERGTAQVETFAVASQSRSPQSRLFAYRRLNRKLHGLFLEPDICAEQNLCVDPKKTLASRWSILLDRAEMYFVEQEDRFAGAALAVNYVKKNKDIWPMVKPHNAVFFFQAFFEPRKSTRLSFLDVWLKRMWSRVKPPSPILFADSDFPKSQGAIAKQEDGNSMSHLVLKSEGSLKQFTSADRLASLLANSFPQSCLTHSDHDAASFSLESPARAPSAIIAKGGNPPGTTVTTTTTTQTEIKSLGLASDVLGKNPKKTTMALLSIEYPDNLGDFKYAKVDQAPAIQKTLSDALKSSSDPLVRFNSIVANRNFNSINFFGDFNPKKMTIAAKSETKNFTTQLTRALEDSHPAVRDIAALSLLPLNPDSPAALTRVRSLLDQGIGDNNGIGSNSGGRPGNRGDDRPNNALPSRGDNREASNPPWWSGKRNDLLRDATETLLEAQKPINREKVSDLFRVLAKEKNPDEREKNLETLKDLYFRNPDYQASVEELGKNLASGKNREFTESLIEKIKSDKTACSADPAADKTETGYLNVKRGVRVASLDHTSGESTANDAEKGARRIASTPKGDLYRIEPSLGSCQKVRGDEEVGQIYFRGTCTSSDQTNYFPSEGEFVRKGDRGEIALGRNGKPVYVTDQELGETGSEGYVLLAGDGIDELLPGPCSCKPCQGKKPNQSARKSTEKEAEEIKQEKPTPF